MVSYFFRILPHVLSEPKNASLCRSRFTYLWVLHVVISELLEVKIYGFEWTFYDIIFVPTFLRLCLNVSILEVERLRWSRGSVLAFGTQVRGFKPGRNRRIFKGK